ncbi:ester cyclase [Rossellomorea aquimaris]|uniref:ester cyclase n=1 Tax=Rossellomorea aquimaris TaxID=189382 RepID=UPI001CD4EF64|nr:ester cyclase [Rossellomorea aquimaris]MCA1055906.1 ester cyclase [Rossellomorea aquimaris]
MVSNNRRNTVDKWFGEYFTKGNLDILDELTTDGFIYHSRNGDNTKEQMKEFMTWYRSVFHDDEWALHDIIEQDHKVVVRYTGWMTYKGGWFNIPSENQRVKETGIMIFYFEGSKVKELWCENSDAGILYDLGALPKDTHEVY